MQKRWRGKNVDLDQLSDSVEDFFKSRSLQPKRAETAGERTISWFPGYRGAGLKEPVTARIFGEPDDFTIDLKASELTKNSIRTGILTKPFGGGYFLLKAVKLKEELERLENEFWIFMEEKIDQLAGSAKQS
jgi:hypothetical protein